MILAVLCALAMLAPSYASLTEGYHKDDSRPTCAGIDPRMFFRFRPGCSEWMTKGGHRYFARYNHELLRGPDYPDKFSGRRILFTGPSVLFGSGVNEPDTIPSKLEKKLRAGKVGKVQVINAGQEGYSSVQTAIHLPDLLQAYKPRIILHWAMFTGSAMRDTVYYRSLEFQNGYPAALTLFPYNRFLNQFLLDSQRKRPQLFRAFYTFNFFLRRAVTTWRCKLRSKDERALGACVAEGTFSSLTVMKNLASSWGIPFYVVYIGDPLRSDVVMNPMFMERIARIFEFFTPDVWVNGATVLALLREKGFNVIHLPRYHNLPPEFFFPNDYHPNEKGAEAAAQELSEQVRPILKEFSRKKR